MCAWSRVSHYRRIRQHRRLLHVADQSAPVVQCPARMAEAVMEKESTEAAEVSRVYEAGYTIVPTVAEDSLEKVVGDIRATIEKAGGSFIAEGAPALQRLAYEMTAREGET